MATVTVVIETVATPFPAGTVLAGIVISMEGIVTSKTITAAPYQAVFDNVAPGTYTATAQAVDHSGSALGAAATSAPFTIAAPDVNVDIPQTVTVTIS